MDHRVDSAREGQLAASGCFPSAGHSPEFAQSVRDYFIHHQCRSTHTPPHPGYAETANDCNVIPHNERPSRNHYLLHFASIDRLMQIVLRGDNIHRADFLLKLRLLMNERPPSDASAGEVTRIVNNLQHQGADAIKTFASLISDALGDTEPHWWAVFAHEIGDLTINQDWTEAVRMIGLGHLESDVWLLAWRYSPEVAGRLYRPTVAEAGCNGFHFPSPPGEKYGIAMPLVPGFPAVRELIHSPLKGDISAQACIGQIGSIVNSPVDIADPTQLSPWFLDRRKKHRKYLAENMINSSQTQQWLTRHADLP
jgi:hypothetical protein